MKDLLVFATILVAAVGGFTQPPDSLWSRRYGGTGWDFCRSVQQTTDGGYILGGDTPGYGSDFWLVKTDSVGDTLWTNHFLETWGESCYSVMQTPDGGYVLGGCSSGYVEFEFSFFMLVKTDSIGQHLWTRTYGGYDRNYCYSAQQTGDSGFILGGLFFGANYDMILVKMNSNGGVCWGRSFGGNGTDECSSVQQTADGGYILGGYTASFGDEAGDVWLLKTDTNGVQLWNRTFGGVGAEQCTSVQQTEDGGYILGGFTESFGAGGRDFWFVRTGSDGDSLWSRTFGGSNSDQCQSIQQTMDGGYILAGTTTSFGAGQSDFWLVKTDANGDSLWSRTFGGENDDKCSCVRQTADGSFILAGTSYSFGAGDPDMWLVKTGPDPVAANIRVFLPSSVVVTAFPNPFNLSAEIRFNLPKAAYLSLRIYDLLGHQVAVLKDGVADAGTHHVTFDGSSLASGIYFARLDAGKFSQTKKLILLK